MKISTKNSFLKLPFLFDSLKLQDDLSTCLAINWKQHFNQSDYSGDWSGIAMRSSSGNEIDILSHPGSEFKDTPLMEVCPYFRKILSLFECEKETIRLLRLAPGSNIKEHRDRGAGYQFGNFRVHIVIRTHPDVSFIVDGVEVSMKTGECWYADFDRPHSVTNNSNEERVHLIMDCIRNEWSDTLFAKAGYDFSLEKTQPDDETFKRMLAELERIDTATSREIILKMKNERNGNAI